LADSVLRIIPLGGAGEIGRNSTLVEYGDDILVIDAGLMFPRYDMLGVDIVIPDYSYLIERRGCVRGIVITHGHEDHTGGLPYLLRYAQAPIYATELTRGLIQVKLREHKLLDSAQLHTMTPSVPFQVGPFSLEPFRVCHSIPDGVGLGITTPAGLVVHSGDFKFDHHPVDGKVTDFGKLAELGGRRPLVLLSDSTNAEQNGATPSELTVGELFDEVCGTAAGRVIVATFASNISRIRQVIEAAGRCGRRVGIVGQSMISNVRMACALGYLSEPSAPFLSVDEIEHMPAEKVALVCTGSQGEPASALVRMVNGGYRQLSIQPGDTVIISASSIPGNEEAINQIVDDLFRRGADVYYDDLMKVHVSGHGSRDELKLMLDLIRPRYFVPIHGEYRHLVLHARLAQEAGIPAENTFVVESGQVLELDEQGGRLAGRVGHGYVYVDGLGIGNVGEVLLRDRYLLSQDGFLIATVLVDEHNGELLLGPYLASRGFVDSGEWDALMEKAKELLVDALRDERHSAAGAPAVIREVLSTFMYSQTKRRPMILPVVMKL